MYVFCGDLCNRSGDTKPFYSESVGIIVEQIHHRLDKELFFFAFHNTTRVHSFLKILCLYYNKSRELTLKRIDE